MNRYGTQFTTAARDNVDVAKKDSDRSYDAWTCRKIKMLAIQDGQAPMYVCSQLDLIARASPSNKKHPHNTPIDAYRHSISLEFGVALFVWPSDVGGRRLIIS